MKKMLKVSGQLIMEALIGFFCVLVVLDENIRFNLSPCASIANIVLFMLAFFFIVFSVYYYFNIFTLTIKNFSGEEEDAIESKMYQQFSDASLFANLAILISLTSLSLPVLTHQGLWLLITSISFMIVSYLMSFLLPTLSQKMYPERKLPSVSDKNYAKKLLAVSDDGEQHAMRGGLFNTYVTLNSLLVAAIILLLLYSIVSGSSQLFSIFTIVIILTLTNTQYVIHVRNK